MLLVSYLLYMNFKPVYAIILFGITAITFYTAKIIEKNKTRRNKYILYLGVLVTLLPLLIFKYYNFINDSCFELLNTLGL